MIRRALLASLVASLCAAVLAVPGGAANECKGIPVCISVPGPWVYVPAHREATYLLECPRRRGVVGGLDALATSRDVRVSFDGRLGSPVAPGMTTSRDAYFRAVTVSGERGAFQPYLGCIPAGGGGGRSTTSARVTPPGVPLDRIAKNVKLGSPSVVTVAVSCPRGERLIGSWHALAFRSRTVPDLVIGGYVRIDRQITRGRVVANVVSSEGVPTAAHAEIQVGAVCAA